MVGITLTDTTVFLLSKYSLIIITEKGGGLFFARGWPEICLFLDTGDKHLLFAMIGSICVQLKKKS